MKIQRVSCPRACLIIASRKPRGLFYTKHPDGYTGIDNTTGDAWTEDFKTLKECKKWLRGEN